MGASLALAASLPMACSSQGLDHKGCMPWPCLHAHGAALALEACMPWQPAYGATFDLGLPLRWPHSCLGLGHMHAKATRLGLWGCIPWPWLCAHRAALALEACMPWRLAYWGCLSLAIGLGLRVTLALASNLWGLPWTWLYPKGLRADWLYPWGLRALRAVFTLEACMPWQPARGVCLALGCVPLGLPWPLQHAQKSSLGLGLGLVLVIGSIHTIALEAFPWQRALALATACLGLGCVPIGAVLALEPCLWGLAWQ